MIERKNPNHKMKARLLQETNGLCPFCDFKDAGLMQFHHIDNNRANTVLENLIAVCPICHIKITANEISVDEVIKKKIKLQKNIMTDNKAEQTTFNIDSENISNSLIGNNNKVILNVKKHVISKNKFVEGELGFETQKANYISHLITRYNEYKTNEVGKENMKYGVFQASLKKHFKIGTTRTLNNLPIGRFPELVELVQKRINTTTFAKKFGKGHKNFSTFQEYLELQNK